MTYITADEVERERANPNATVLPGNSGVDNGILANPGKHPEFAIPEVRQALLMAIDRQSIVDQIYGGAANIVPCLYGLPNLTGSVTPTAVRSRRRQGALTKAGVDLAKMGELHVRHVLRRPAVGQRHDRHRRNWKTNLGIDGQATQPMENAAWQKHYYEDGGSDISFWGAANGPTGDVATTTSTPPLQVSDRGQRVKGYNYSNPELDKLLEDARVEFDQAKQDAIYQQVCQITKDTLPNLYLWQTVRFHVVSKKATTSS